MPFDNSNGTNSTSPTAAGETRKSAAPSPPSSSSTSSPSPPPSSTAADNATNPHRPIPTPAVNAHTIAPTAMPYAAVPSAAPQQQQQQTMPTGSAPASAMPQRTFSHADYISNVSQPAAFHSHSGMSGMNGTEDSGPSFAEMYTTTAKKYQAFLDRINGKFHERWTFLGACFLVYLVRTLVYPGGWYIITYGLGIYILNLFIAFLSPKFDPELELDDDDDGSGRGGARDDSYGMFNPRGRRADSSSSSKSKLPGMAVDDGEVRPFYRRLPEFKFWWATTRGVLVALLCTITRATDVPVYWPILLVYFIFLFAFSMRKQIHHMVRYRYVPWTMGKKRYDQAASASTAGTASAAIGQFVNSTVNSWVSAQPPPVAPPFPQQQPLSTNPYTHRQKARDRS